MLVREAKLKYIINIEVHFVGYMYIMHLINAWKMEHIKINAIFFLRILEMTPNFKIY